MTPYNPLVRFQEAMVPGLLQMGNKYLVSQTFDRGESEREKNRQPLLLTDYESLAEAKDHCNTLQLDPWAAVIYLENDRHLAKLRQMLGPDSAYRLFAAFVEDKKKINLRNERVLTEAVRAYIREETQWSPSRGESIRAILELSLGELMLRLAHGGEVLKERLSAFEAKIGIVCATTSPSRPPSELYRITFQNSLSTPK